MKNKLKLIVLCGFPASGKNTWIEKNKKGYVVVELDEIRRLIYGHQFHTNAEPFVIAFAKSMVRLLLAQGKNVILNSTGLTRWTRQEWYNIGKEYKADITVVWIKTNAVTCNARNINRINNRIPQDAMDRLISNFQEPLIDYIDNGFNIKLKIVKSK